MSGEAAVAAAYVLLLILAATALDLMARHTHNRAGRFRTAGFTYYDHLDVWECPEGQHLHRVELDHQRRLVRYRGKAAICNACPSKGDCTDSDRGREIVRALDPWPHSEAGRFHRGISVAILALAVLVSVVALVRNHAAPDLAALGTALLLSGALLIRMASSFLHTPANFPATLPPAGRSG
jgi:hypothetical protein